MAAAGRERRLSKGGASQRERTGGRRSQHSVRRGTAAERAAESVRRNVELGARHLHLERG